MHEVSPHENQRFCSWIIAKMTVQERSLESLMVFSWKDKHWQTFFFLSKLANIWGNTITQCNYKKKTFLFVFMHMKHTVTSIENAGKFQF